ncbi:RHS repeat domain-containing protein [Chryseobacterium koreense]
MKNRYIYQYKDHLGNVRVSFSKNPITQSVEVLDTNDYYPFGMNHLNPDQESFFGASSYKNYKFGGKELQETGFYDFDARFYMPDLGRFGTMDPRSQYTHEAYSYVWNNPINFFAPTGMAGTVPAFSGGTFAALLTRALSIGALLSIKNDAPPER